MPSVLWCFVACICSAYWFPAQSEKSYELDASTCADFSGSYLSPSDYAVIKVEQVPPDYDCSSLQFVFPNEAQGFGRALGNKLYLGNGRFVGTYRGDKNAAFVTFNHKDNSGHDYTWVKLQNACQQVDGVWRGKLNLAGVFRLGAGSTLNGEFVLEQLGCKVVLRTPAGHPDWPKEQVIGAVVGNQMFSVFHTTGVIVNSGSSIRWPDNSVWNREARLVSQSHLNQPALVGRKTLNVQDSSGWNVGDYIRIGKDITRITSVFPLVVSTPLEMSYPAGTNVERIKAEDSELIKADEKLDPCAPEPSRKYLEHSRGMHLASHKAAEEEPMSSRLSHSFLAVSCVMLVLVGVACFVRTAKKMRGHPAEPRSLHAATSVELERARPSMEDSALLTESDTTA